MNKIYKLSFIVLLSIIGFTSYSQKSFFSDISEAQIKSTSGKHLINPVKFRGVSLNNAEMKNFLWSLPSEKDVKNRKLAPVLELPMPNGVNARFNVWESSIQEPGLESKFPEIKTFLGQGIDDPYATVRFDYTTRGFHAQVLTTNGDFFIDPYIITSIDRYMSYYRTDLLNYKDFSCGVNEVSTASRPENTQASCLGTQLRTYRLAVACTGEYAQAPGVAAGANAATLHSAIVTSVNRVVGVYEREVAIRMILVANNNLVEFLDANTDPFTGNNSAGVLINESQTVIDANIGSANYDIGHTFSTGGGGLAQLGCVCGSSKARGITGSPQPTGDGYDIDYVAHEMGHQFGGSHTFNSVTANCGGGNRSAAQAYEVGSGTSIQAYAGICGSDDIQLNSDPHFHAVSFDQISNFIVTAGGASCGVISNTGNNLPVITLPLANNNLTIPINTPFTLSGAATDADGDALTYCWEQWDLGPGGAWNSGATSTTAPLFKSRVPKTVGTRTFPDNAVILANFPANPAATLGGLKGETLPQVARVMNFRLTVRDSRPAGGGVVSAGSGGCQNSTPFIVNTFGTTPFTVTVPNGGESYFTSSTQMVTWNNAATNAVPFNVSNVKITYSSDGGLTYPITLLASTPNTGIASVTMPSVNTTTARVKVEAIGNIFFDISNANFSLTTPPTDFNFGTTTATTSACPAASTLTVSIPTTQTGGFSNPITMSATAGVPAGTTVTFSPNPVTPGVTTVATLNNANTLAAGTYSITVSGAATGASTKTTTISYTITAGAPPTITTQPTSVSVCVPATATFTVASSTAGVSYQWQSALPAGAFSNIAGATSASYTSGATSAASNGFQYRCIISTQCGTVTSNIAILTANTAAAITAQPTNQAACTGTGATATFTVGATGTGVAYQWQSGTSGTGPWTNVGTNSATYTTPAVTLTTPAFYRVLVSTTTCPANLTSNVATLTISAITAIGTQPSSQTVCAGSTATFTSSSTGTNLTYQWQMNTTAAPTFVNIPGATSANYTTAATTAAMSGNQYQVVVTGTCNTVTSTPATLTVNTPAAATANPTAVTVCNGQSASFTGAGTGTGASYQWQVSTTGVGGTYTNIAGATAATYTIASTIPSQNGNYYRLVVTTTTCAGTSITTAALLTVNTVAVIGTQPTAQSACIPQTATFNVAATGTGLTYQWQLAPAGSTTFTDIAGATSASYTTPASVLSMNGNQYKVNILSTCSPTTPTTSSVVVLTVTNPVTKTLQPTDQKGCIGDNYTFNASASAPGNSITFQWQVSTTGAPGTFTNIAGANGTGATLGTLATAYTITGAGSFLNGTYYRVYFSVPCGSGISSDTSSAAKLTLSFKPSVVITAPSTSSTNPAVNSTILATVSPATGLFLYNWTKNGTIIPNSSTTTSFTLPVDDNGMYVVSVTDPATGCTSATASLTTNSLTSDNLSLNQVYIYPNPVSNIVYIRYNTSGLTPRGTMLNMYDEKGARVFTKEYSITGTLGRMAVDMSNFRPATYLVYIMDAAGNKLGGGKVVKVNN